TTGGTTTFGAHALTRTSAASSSLRIRKRVYIRSVTSLRTTVGLQTIRETARNVGHDRHLTVTRLVENDRAVPVESRDPLTMIGIVGVERQRDAADVERNPRRDRFHELVDTVAGQRRDAERRRVQICRP